MIPLLHGSAKDIRQQKLPKNNNLTGIRYLALISQDINVTLSGVELSTLVSYYLIKMKPRRKLNPSIPGIRYQTSVIKSHRTSITRLKFFGHEHETIQKPSPDFEQMWVNKPHLIASGTSGSEHLCMMSATVELLIFAVKEVDKIYQLFLTDVTDETRGVPEFARSRFQCVDGYVSRVERHFALK